jgi:large subunit ribosomal protein L17
MNGERKIIMAKYRKLGRTSAQRKALLRNQVTAVINNGKIVTTEAKAKEVQKIVDGLIALAVKEKDNFETVKVTTKVARKDKDGKRVKQIVDKETGKVLAESHRDKDGKLVKIENGVTVTVYDEVEKEIKKDLPTRSTSLVFFFLPAASAGTSTTGFRTFSI